MEYCECQNWDELDEKIKRLVDAAEILIDKNDEPFYLSHEIEQLESALADVKEMMEGK